MAVANGARVAGAPLALENSFADKDEPERCEKVNESVALAFTHSMENPSGTPVASNPVTVVPPDAGVNISRLVVPPTYPMRVDDPRLFIVLTAKVWVTELEKMAPAPAGPVGPVTDGPVGPVPEGPVGPVAPIPIGPVGPCGPGETTVTTLVRVDPKNT